MLYITHLLINNIVIGLSYDITNKNNNNVMIFRLFLKIITR